MKNSRTRDVLCCIKYELDLAINRDEVREILEKIDTDYDDFEVEIDGQWFRRELLRKDTLLIAVKILYMDLLYIKLKHKSLNPLDFMGLQDKVPLKEVGLELVRQFYIRQECHRKFLAKV